MPSQLEAIEIKRKMYFEHEGAPYHCLDVEVSKPTARGGQTLVRLKMRNLLTRAVFDKTFKAGDKFKEPDLARVEAIYQYADGDGFHFMDQETFETLTLRPDMIGDDSDLLVDELIVQINKFNGNPIGVQLPPLVEMTIKETEPGTRGDTASGSVTKVARTDTGLELRVPLFIKEGERVRVHTETREFAGRAWQRHAPGRGVRAGPCPGHGRAGSDRQAVRSRAAHRNRARRFSRAFRYQQRRVRDRG